MKRIKLVTKSFLMPQINNNGPQRGSEIYLSQELLLLRTVFYVSLLYIHDRGNVWVGVKERHQEIRNADKKMVNDKA